MSSTHPNAGTRSSVARVAVGIGGAASHGVAAVPPRVVVASVLCVQWILALVTAVEVGHNGSLAIVVPQVLLLLPVALVLVYGASSRLGGRTFAAWAASVWVALPYLGIAYTTPSLRHEYQHAFLPRVLGLSDDPKFAGMVAFLAALFFALRAAENRTSADVVLAVAAAGLGAALVPRAALVAVVPVAALTAGGGRRCAVAAAAGVAILLAGVGGAVAAGLLASPFAHVDVHAAGNTLASLRENFWSGRLIEWTAVAGVAGAVRRRPAVGAAIAVALLAGLLSVHEEIHAIARNVSLLQALIPVWSAVVMAVASLPLLWPGRPPVAGRAARL